MQRRRSVFNMAMLSFGVARRGFGSMESLLSNRDNIRSWDLFAIT
jgi:hypothetical protein